MHPRTKHLYLFLILLALFVALTGLFFVEREAPRNLPIEQGVQVFSQPEDAYSVDRTAIQNDDLERNAFIVRVRNTLPPESAESDISEGQNEPSEESVLSNEGQIVIENEAQLPEATIATSTMLGTSTLETHGDSHF